MGSEVELRRTLGRCCGRWSLVAWSSATLVWLFAAGFSEGARAATVVVLTDPEAWAAATTACADRWHERSLHYRWGRAFRDSWRRLAEAETALEVLDFATVEQGLARLTTALRRWLEAPPLLRWRVTVLRWRFAQLREAVATERNALAELVRLAVLYPEYVRVSPTTLRRVLARERERYEREGWVSVRLVPTPLTGPTLDSRGRLRLPRALLPVTVSVSYPRVGWLSLTLPWRPVTSYTVAPLAGRAGARLVPVGVAVWARDATGPALWMSGAPRWRPGDGGSPCRYVEPLGDPDVDGDHWTSATGNVAARPPGTGTTPSIGGPRWPWVVGALVAAGLVASSIWWATRPPPTGALVVHW